MQVLRLSTPILRSSTRAMTMRMYSPGPEGKAGSVAGSKTWNTREKAVADPYIIQHEREQLEALREARQAREKVVDDVRHTLLTPALQAGEEVNALDSLF